MQYNVVWKIRAIKQLTKIHVKEHKRIHDEVKKLEDSETWHNVKKLTNHKYDYRLRVGDYRVLFNVNENGIEIDEVSIEEVKKRDERTY